jgi:hypothetical protein
MEMEITIKINTAELHNVRNALETRLNKIKEVIELYADLKYNPEYYQKEYNRILSIIQKLDDQVNQHFNS